MTSRLEGRTLILDVPLEPDLVPGPAGRLLVVADYDPLREVWYTPVDLDDPWILAQDGLQPTESDPRSHQQIVYAVASSVIERVERFMGRRFRWYGKDILTLVPHAFEGSNAFFSPRHGVLFGYYSADSENPGANLPGQTIFTCLSSDIIAHEVTHAIVHRLRKFYIEPTNDDMLALHEGVADLVALFQHFAHREIVSDAIAKSSSDIIRSTGLFDLAREFGESTGRGAALRSAIDLRARANPDVLESSVKRAAASPDPHVRAANFVLAVFDAFLLSYQGAIADLLRIATGGTGTLPAGHLHPDLVERVTTEAIKTADRFLGMVVRAFDYMPVVDATFGDLVRSIVTADFDLYPEDGRRLRATLVESLRRHGIAPDVASLSDSAMIWPAPSSAVSLAGAGNNLLERVLASGTKDLDLRGRRGGIRAEPPTDDDDSDAEGIETNTVQPGVPGDPDGAGVADGSGAGRDSSVRAELENWCTQNADTFGLSTQHPDSIRLRGVHVSYRLANDGQPRPEIVLQFSQNRPDLEIDLSQPDSTASQRRFYVRAGVALVLKADGAVRYVIAKPLPTSRDAVREPGAERLSAVEQWVKRTNDSDAAGIWLHDSPAVLRMSFARLHQEEQ